MTMISRSLVLDTHAPATELFNDAVVGNGLANHEEGPPRAAILGRTRKQVNARGPRSESWGSRNQKNRRSEGTVQETDFNNRPGSPFLLPSV